MTTHPFDSNDQPGLIDNAGALLAHILDDTRDLAQKEERELLDALEERKRADQRRQHEAEARKREEAEQRLREEAERQRHARDRRTGLLRQINGPSEYEVEARRQAEEEARRANEFQRRLEVAEAARLAAEARAAEAARVATAREEQHLAALAHVTPQSTPKHSGAAVWLAAMAALTMCVAVSAALVAALMSDSGRDERVYTKAIYTPMAMDTPAVTYGFVAQNDPEPQIEATRETPNPRVRARIRNTTTNNRDGSKGADGRKPFGFDLSGGDNVFDAGRE